MALKSTTAQTMGHQIIEKAVEDILAGLDVDTQSDGLQDTPKRVARALIEMTSGYREDPKEILSRTFDGQSDEMVVLRGIRFWSMCEHHLLPFGGSATLAYVPDGRVVGISKLARLVTCFSKRLQIQERLTGQIVDAMMEHLKPLGAGAVMNASHGCMVCRGVLQPDSEMVTSALRGVFLTKPEARAEFLSLSRLALSQT